MKTVLSRLWRVLQTIIFAWMVLLILANVYILGSRFITGNPNPTVLGFHWAVVLSGSMEPRISVDDMVISRRQGEYAVGDIVTFESGNTLITHRIVGENEEGFITQGDANNTADRNPVRQEQILGKVIGTVPYVGLVIYYLKTPLGMTCLVLGGLLMIELPHLIRKKS